MICRYCGAAYEEDSIKCPYCHSENSDAAKKQKQEILSSYDREAEDIKRQAESFPQRTAEKWTAYLLWGLGALAILAFLAVIAAICIGRLSVKGSYESEKKHLAALEALYQAEDYGAIHTYIREESLWSSAYDKYSQVSSVYDRYVYFEKGIAYLEELAAFQDVSAQEKKEMLRGWSEDVIAEAFWILSAVKVYTEDAVFLGNEEELGSFYEACAGILESYGYTEEEIAQIEQGKDADGWDDLIQKLQEYFYAQID